MFSKLIAGACLIFGINGACWRGEVTKDDLKDVATFKNFKEWQNEYDIIFDSFDAESIGYLTWLDNLEKIAEINSKDLTYKLKLNQFGAMTPEEFKYAVHGQDGACFKRSELFDYQNAQLIDESQPVNAPASVDWRTKGVVTPVKNQGQCVK